MQIPVQVAFHGLPTSEAVEAACHEEAAKLERFCDRITSCRIVVAEPHRNHRKGNLYEVRLDITVPGSEIVVNREHHQPQEDVFMAIRDAFGTAKRQLEEYVQRLRHQVKNHASNDEVPG